MSQPAALITTEQLATILGDPNLRLYDCTTYLEPAPPGSDVPYRRRARRQDVRGRPHPGRRFPRPAGRVLRHLHAAALHDAGVPQLEAAFGRHGARRRQAHRALQHRHDDVGDAVLVDAALARLSTRRCSTAASTNGRPKGGRSRPARRRAIRHDLQGRAARGLLRRQECGEGAHRRSSTVIVNALGPQFHQGPRAEPLRPAGPRSRQRQRAGGDARQSPTRR